MNKIDNFLYFICIIMAMIVLNNRADLRAQEQATGLGGYTKYVGEQIIKSVERACNAPNV